MHQGKNKYGWQYTTVSSSSTTKKAKTGKGSTQARTHADRPKNHFEKRSISTISHSSRSIKRGSACGPRAVSLRRLPPMRNHMTYCCATNSSYSRKRAKLSATISPILFYNRYFFVGSIERKNEQWLSIDWHFELESNNHCKTSYPLPDEEMTRLRKQRKLSVKNDWKMRK